MMNELITHIELHSPTGIRHCFRNGLSPNDTFNNRQVVYQLVGEYTRTPRFKECINVFIEYGLEFDDKALLTVLADEPAMLEVHLKSQPELINRRYTLPCSYTPLQEASLLHICAEFNHVSCAQILIRYGADVNFKAGADDYGFGGQTPIFHTVCQNSNNSAEMLQLLIDHNADLSITVPGFIWGKGYEWETLIPAVNPISYAMMGLLPQMHRVEKQIAGIVALLLKRRYGIDYIPQNIPCKYLLS